MPITKDRFEVLDDSGVSPGTNAETIVDFLLQHQDHAFRQKEIAEETGIPRGSIGPTLNRLEARGVVVHRNTYWAIDDAYVANRSGVVLTDAAAADYDGKEFDVEAWESVAEDR